MNLPVIASKAEDTATSGMSGCEGSAIETLKLQRATARLAAVRATWSSTSFSYVDRAHRALYKLYMYICMYIYIEYI